MVESRSIQTPLLPPSLRTHSVWERYVPVFRIILKNHNFSRKNYVDLVWFGPLAVEVMCLCVQAYYFHIILKVRVEEAYNTQMTYIEGIGDEVLYTFAAFGVK